MKVLRATSSLTPTLALVRAWRLMKDHDFDIYEYPSLLDDRIVELTAEEVRRWAAGQGLVRQ